LLVLFFFLLSQGLVWWFKVWSACLRAFKGTKCKEGWGKMYAVVLDLGGLLYFFMF